MLAPSHAASASSMRTALRRIGLKLPRQGGFRGFILAGPAFLYAGFLLAAPLVGIVALSFWTQDYLELVRTFTLDNFREAWTEPVYRVLMLRALGVSAAVTAITVIAAFPVAYFVSFHAAPAKKHLWIFLIIVPFWTSYLLRIFMWKVILGYNGLINGTLTGLGLISEPLPFLLYNAAAVIITLSHAWLPFAVLPIFIALEKIDRTLLDAAKDLGDNAFRRFTRVIIPLAMPGVVAAALIVFIPTVGDYVTPRLVGGPDGLLIANMIELQFKKANNAPLGSALAISAMFVVAVLAAIFLLIARRHVAKLQP